MAVVSAIDTFLEAVRKSGLVDEPRLEAQCKKLSAAADPQPLATALIHDGLLTNFQARQLLLGKWRGFLISGKYKVLELLGSGGMGQVFLCEQVRMRRLVALKVLPTNKNQDAEALARFEREARAIAAVDHPNLVRAHDIDQDGKLHFMVMEYVDGSSLQHIVSQFGPLDVVRAAHYISQAACGLQRAGELSWVHRDIKPGNILVDRQGAVKILDMGLARLFEGEQETVTEKYDEKAILGTADYLAPEQAMNSKGVDIRADIYSLGGTFFYLLTGRTPFGQGTVRQKLIWHQMRPVDPVTSLRPEVPAALEAVLAKMLAKEPADRFQAPIEVAEALAPWTQTPIAPPPEQEMPQHCPALRHLCQSYVSTARSAAFGMRPAPGSMGGSHHGSGGFPVLAPDPNPTTARPPVLPAVKPAQSRLPWLVGGGAAVVGLVLIAGLLVLAAGLPGPKEPAAAQATPRAEDPPKPHVVDKPVSPDDAGKHVNKQVVIEMEVKTTRAIKDKNVVFLNSRNVTDTNNFTVFITAKAAQKMRADGINDPEAHFRNKVIQVNGTVTLYHSKPQIQVDDPKQIQVMTKKP